MNVATIDDLIATLAEKLRSLEPEERQMHLDRLGEQVMGGSPRKARRQRLSDVVDIDYEMLDLVTATQIKGEPEG